MAANCNFNVQSTSCAYYLYIPLRISRLEFYLQDGVPCRVRSTEYYGEYEGWSTLTAAKIQGPLLKITISKFIHGAYGVLLRTTWYSIGVSPGSWTVPFENRLRIMSYGPGGPSVKHGRAGIGTAAGPE